MILETNDLRVDIIKGRIERTVYSHLLQKGNKTKTLLTDITRKLRFYVNNGSDYDDFHFPIKIVFDNDEIYKIYVNKKLDNQLDIKFSYEFMALSYMLAHNEEKFELKYKELLSIFENCILTLVILNDDNKYFDFAGREIEYTKKVLAYKNLNYNDPIDKIINKYNCRLNIITDKNINDYEDNNDKILIIKERENGVKNEIK